MYYYDPDNKNPRRWAAVAAAVYCVLLAGSFALVSFDVSQAVEKPGDTILVDFTEPPVPEPPKPPGPWKPLKPPPPGRPPGPRGPLGGGGGGRRQRRRYQPQPGPCQNRIGRNT